MYTSTIDQIILKLFMYCFRTVAIQENCYHVNATIYLNEKYFLEVKIYQDLTANSRNYSIS